MITRKRKIVISEGENVTLPFDNVEYIARQSRLFDQMPDSSVIIIPTNDRAMRSNDVHYRFRPNSYMLYLCGWAENEGVFVASNESGEWRTKLFVSPRDTKKEIWEGIRIGIEGAANWPCDRAENLENLELEIEKLLSNCDHVYSLTGISSRIDDVLGKNVDILNPKQFLDSMRRVKSSREIELMQQAADIASNAHVKAMRASYPGIGEWQIQSIIESHFTDSKSQWSFPSIVGGGDNGTILHYNSNDSIIEDGALVLVDAGCEVCGYASDITRTWPVNGKFTDAQREIYQIVLDAGIAAIDSCRPGFDWVSMHLSASKVIAQGLIDLGLINCTLEDAMGDPEEFDGVYRNFFMHGTGHLLGLDVHDVGGGRQGDSDKGPILEPGMIVTVEPGLYFGSWRSDVEIPTKYSGIGIRIEDDVLISENGPIVLSSSCPKEISEIEKIIGSGV